MAAIVNDRDIILQSAPYRLETNVSSNAIDIISNASGFSVTNGIATPSTITLSCQLRGQVYGTPTYTIEPEIGGGNGIAFIDTTSIPGSCIIAYTSMLKDQCTIKASLTFAGAEYTDTIIIPGKITTPANVTNTSATPDGNKLKLSWNKNIEIDLGGYEVRESDTGWGNNSYLFRGNTANCTVPPGAVGVSKTWYVKAYNTSNLYSPTATSVSYTVPTPSNVTNIVEDFFDTSLTNSTVTISWTAATTLFELKEYLVEYDSESIAIKSNTVTVAANWLGDKTFTVKTVDTLGNVSSGTSKSITKLPPGQVTNFRAQVIDNNVLLYWSLPAKTTLPIAHILLKKTVTNAPWASMTPIGTKSGEFTSIQELNADEYKYGIAVVDTDGNEGTPVYINAQVAQPPDFVYNAQFISTFANQTYQTVTFSNASKSTDGSVALPVNLTETWQTHFTNNSWNTPQDQINAGYTYFAQPGTSTGYYEEVFDYQQILGSSNIIVSLGSETTVGTINSSVTISISTNGSTWTDFSGLDSIFATNFRYVKVRITATQSTTGALYRIYSLVVRLDTKLKVDSGTSYAVSTDTSGTIVNFNAEFFDISSITLAPQSTVVRSAIYDFYDAILIGSYTITSNVCTIVTGSAHNLIAGQRVRCFSSTGNLPNGVYTIASVTNSTTYTFSVTAANGSGSVSTYPNSMRIYLHDPTVGTRQSGTVSWTARGN